MDYERVSLAVAEMLDVGYTHEWISYLLDIYGVPKQYERPRPPRSKYMYCKDLFARLEVDPTTADVVPAIADYIIRAERFDRNLQQEALRHLPIFKSILVRAGYQLPEDHTIRVTPYFRTRDLRIDTHRCFVLMPFNVPLSRRIFDEILKPLFETCGLGATRADNMWGADIMEDVWRAINESFVIVADVTGRNANVFYELGIAHTLGKNVILLTQDDRDVPFDIARFRYIKYEDNLDGYRVLQQQIPEFIEQMRRPRNVAIHV
jgi:hypothetical protein